MTPPIIVDAVEDVLVFDSVEKAELYLEPFDVKNEPIRVFDGEGRLLRAVIVETKGPICTKVERVRFDSVDVEPKHQSELWTLLIEYLSRAERRSREQFESQTLEELVRKALEYKIE
jgi:hypothetical protein